jgi:hypothetical protein
VDNRASFEVLVLYAPLPWYSCPLGFFGRSARSTTFPSRPHVYHAIPRHNFRHNFRIAVVRIPPRSSSLATIRPLVIRLADPQPLLFVVREWTKYTSPLTGFAGDLSLPNQSVHDARCSFIRGVPIFHQSQPDYFLGRTPPARPVCSVTTDCDCSDRESCSSEPIRRRSHTSSNLPITQTPRVWVVE